MPPRNRLIVPVAITARSASVSGTKKHLGYTPVPKKDHDEDAHELRERLPQAKPDATP